MQNKWFLYSPRNKSVRFGWDGKVYSAFDTKEDAEAALVVRALLGVDVNGWVAVHYDDLPYEAAALLPRVLVTRNAMAKKVTP